MRSFDEVHAMAARRKGGPAKLESLLSVPLPAGKLRRIPDDRWLSAITKCIFQAGFNWKVIESKWDRFEEVFEGFEIGRWALMSPDDLDHLLKAEGIVRNAAKIRAVGENAAFLGEVAREHGSAGAYFSAWREADYCQNLRVLQKRGARLGGRTGQIFLRRMGVATLVFSPDVLKALAREDVVDRMPSSKESWDRLQAAIDLWSEQSGRSLTEISQILAYSVD